MNRVEQQYVGSLELAVSRHERNTADLCAQIEGLESERDVNVEHVLRLQNDLAQRDQRIAELEADRLYCWAEAETDPQCGLSLDEAIRHAMRKARAEVPEWCSGLLLAMHAAGQLTLTPNQLRACGIEVP